MHVHVSTMFPSFPYGNNLRNSPPSWLPARVAFGLGARKDGCFRRLIEKTLFPVSVLSPRCKLCLHYTAGNFNENPSMRAVAKILQARASEYSSNCCEQFEQRPNFVSTFKLNGTIRYPYKDLLISEEYAMMNLFPF